MSVPRTLRRIASWGNLKFMCITSNMFSLEGYNNTSSRIGLRLLRLSNIIFLRLARMDEADFKKLLNHFYGEDDEAYKKCLHFLTQTRREIAQVEGFVSRITEILKER